MRKKLAQFAAILCNIDTKMLMVLDYTFAQTSLKFAAL